MSIVPSAPAKEIFLLMHRSELSGRRKAKSYCKAMIFKTNGLRRVKSEQLLRNVKLRKVYKHLVEEAEEWRKKVEELEDGFKELKMESLRHSLRGKLYINGLPSEWQTDHIRKNTIRCTIWNTEGRRLNSKDYEAFRGEPGIFEKFKTCSEKHMASTKGELMAKGGKEKRTGADEAVNRRGQGCLPGLPLSDEEEKKKEEEKNRKDREDQAKKTVELMAEGGKEKRTGADEEGNRRRPGRLPGPLLSREEDKKMERIRRDREYRARKTMQLKEYKDFCKQLGIADIFKVFRERENQGLKEELKDIVPVLMLQLKEYKQFCEQLGIADIFKAFRERGNQDQKEESKKVLQGLMNNETNEDIEISTGSWADGSSEGELCSSTTWDTPLTADATYSPATGGGMGTPFEPPTMELKRKREEELGEARRGKIATTTVNYTIHDILTGGSQLCGLMADPPQTAHQSALPGQSSTKVAQQNEQPKWFNLLAQKQHDTYVPECPSSHGADQTQWPQLDAPSWTTVVMPGMGSPVDPASLGFHCRKRPPHESWDIEVVTSKMLDRTMSEMQERLQRMEDNVKAQIQRSVVAALTEFGYCPHANTPSVTPTEPHHDPLGMLGGTNGAAGSSGGPTTQSFSNNEEV